MEETLLPPSPLQPSEKCTCLNITFIDDPIQRQKDSEEGQTASKNRQEVLYNCLHQQKYSICRIFQFVVFVVIIVGCSIVIHSNLQIIQKCSHTTCEPNPNYDWFHRERCHYTCLRDHEHNIWMYCSAVICLVISIQMMIRSIYIHSDINVKHELHCVNGVPNVFLCRKITLWTLWIIGIGLIVGIVYFSVYDISTCTSDCQKSLHMMDARGGLIACIICFIIIKLLWLFSAEWLSKKR